MVRLNTMIRVSFLAAVTLTAGRHATAITVTVPVVHGDDDAEETVVTGYNAIMGGPLHLTSSDLELGGEETGGDLLEVGVRFVDVDVPPGVTIDEAFIEFAASEDNNDNTSVRVGGLLDANPPRFTANNGDISLRAKSASSVDWNNIDPWSVANPRQRTPDLASIVQELVDQPDWSAGNPMSFSISPNPGGRRAAVSFNGAERAGDLTLAPSLTVSFTTLLAGDADEDLDFDQFDLIRVQQSAKYRSGQAATWGEGDWDGAPGGAPGRPPAGDGVFDQFDIITAQIEAIYLTGSYGAIVSGGGVDDDQSSVIYDANTGEVSIDAPAGTEMTSVNIDSATRIFTGDAAENLGGSFDNDADDNIFKATFGSSFGSLSFGSVAVKGLSEQFVLDDLTVIGSLAGGGSLGDVDLIYVPVPEPATILLMVIAMMSLAARRSSFYRSTVPVVGETRQG